MERRSPTQQRMAPAGAVVEVEPDSRPQWRDWAVALSAGVAMIGWGVLGALPAEFCWSAVAAVASRHGS